ncbi:MAG: 5-formyltetrahydrofolate cyclo-ligase [Parvularculaceae bacterium]
MLPPIAPFGSAKEILRERMKAERREAAKARPDAAEHAARLFLEHIPVSEGAAVSLYYAIGSELDTTPLMKALTERKAILALPVVMRKKQPLIFRRYTPGDTLVRTGFGLMTPAPNKETVIPEIVVTPLLAFTRNGGRLGFGGGFYDRTLAKFREKESILVVGYAYGAQEVDALPLTPLDQPLDWIITEREAIRV